MQQYFILWLPLLLLYHLHRCLLLLLCCCKSCSFFFYIVSSGTRPVPHSLVSLCPIYMGVTRTSRTVHCEKLGKNRARGETRPGNRQWRNFLFVPFHGHCSSEPLLWSHWNECGCSMHSSREMCVLELWSMWLWVHPFCMATKKCQFFIVTRFWK